MCGRYASIKAPADLADEFRAVDAIGGEAPGADYNVAPTKPVIAVVQRHPRDDEGTPDRATTVRYLRLMRWGLVPFWAKDRSGAARMINARVETVATKRAYRAALVRRRCLLPAAGWYEWKRPGAADGGAPGGAGGRGIGGKTGVKQPFFLTTPGDGSVAMAGLWEVWQESDDAEPLVTATVITTEATGAAAWIHDRMPFVLPASAWERWLDPDNDDVAGLLTAPVSELEMWPVSTEVNNVRHNAPELVEPATPEPAALTLDL